MGACAQCEAELNPDGPSFYFCSMKCQFAWSCAQTDSLFKWTMDFDHGRNFHPEQETS